jgi:hypothetical protein
LILSYRKAKGVNEKRAERSEQRGARTRASLRLARNSPFEVVRARRSSSKPRGRKGERGERREQCGRERA